MPPPLTKLVKLIHLCAPLSNNIYDIVFLNPIHPKKTLNIRYFYTHIKTKRFDNSCNELLYFSHNILK